MTGPKSDQWQRFPDPGRACDHQGCVTCSDQAAGACIVELLEGGMAIVYANGALEEISVELIDDAAAGDVVLVHAKVAIAKLLPPP